MSVTGRFGCCCGGCGFLGAHIRRTFPGWRKPLPEDFGEWIIDGSSSAPEVEDWVSRHGAYDLDYLPWFTNPEDWGPQCAKYNPIRFMGVQVNATGVYVADGNPEAPVVGTWSYVYDALRKKEIWYTDSLGRTGLKTEVYNIVGQDPPLYAATRNEETGDWEQDGTNPDLEDLYANHRPPRGLDIYAALANPLGGTARLLIEETTHEGNDAVRIVKEVHDPVMLGSLTVVQVYKQEIILYNPWTFSEFENWLGTLLDEVKLDTPLHEYAAGLLYASPGGFNATASTLLEWMRDYEPFYTSQIDVWPNRVAVNFDKSVLWFDARWMPVAALRHTIGDGLQLLRRRINSPTAACLLSYEYAAPPEDIWVGLGYGDTCPVAQEVSGALKTGDYILEAGGHAGGNRVFTPADIAYENGILFIGLQRVGSTPVVGVDNMPLDTSSRPCLPLGGEYPPGSPLPPWNDGMPMSLDTETFLEEAAEIEAGCYP